MLIFDNFSRHNLMKRYTKTHQIARYFQNFLGDLAYTSEAPNIYDYTCNYN